MNKLLQAFTIFLAVSSFFSLPSMASDSRPPHFKDHVPVSIFFTASPKAELGERVEVLVRVKIHQDADDLHVAIPSSEGIAVLDGDADLDFGAQAKNSILIEKITVSPRAEGRVYLNVFVDGVFEGVAKTRIGVMSLMVGDVDPRRNVKLQGRLETDASGQQVIVLPAEE